MTYPDRERLTQMRKIQLFKNSRPAEVLQINESREFHVDGKYVGCYMVRQDRQGIPQYQFQDAEGITQFTDYLCTTGEVEGYARMIAGLYLNR